MAPQLTGTNVCARVSRYNEWRGQILLYRYRSRPRRLLDNDNDGDGIFESRESGPLAVTPDLRIPDWVLKNP